MSIIIKGRAVVKGFARFTNGNTGGTPGNGGGDTGGGDTGGGTPGGAYTYTWISETFDGTGYLASRTGSTSTTGWTWDESFGDLYVTNGDATRSLADFPEGYVQLPTTKNVLVGKSPTDNFYLESVMQFLPVTASGTGSSDNTSITFVFEDWSDPTLEILYGLDGAVITLYHAESGSTEVAVPTVTLGTDFTVRMEVTDGLTTVKVNGTAIMTDVDAGTFTGKEMYINTYNNRSAWGQNEPEFLIRSITAESQVDPNVLVAPTATPITLDYLSSEYTIAAGSPVWYKFTLDVMTTITIDTVSSTDPELSDTKIGLFNAAGELIAEGDDVTGSDYRSKINASDLPAGEYYIAVGSYRMNLANDFSAIGGNETPGVVLNVRVGTF